MRFYQLETLYYVFTTFIYFFLAILMKLCIYYSRLQFKLVLNLIRSEKTYSDWVPKVFNILSFKSVKLLSQYSFCKLKKTSNSVNTT